MPAHLDFGVNAARIRAVSTLNAKDWAVYPLILVLRPPSASPTCCRCLLPSKYHAASAA